MSFQPVDKPAFLYDLRVFFLFLTDLWDDILIYAGEVSISNQFVISSSAFIVPEYLNIFHVYGIIWVVRNGESL